MTDPQKYRMYLVRAHMDYIMNCVHDRHSPFAEGEQAHHSSLSLVISQLRSMI